MPRTTQPIGQANVPAAQKRATPATVVPIDSRITYRVRTTGLTRFAVGSAVMVTTPDDGFRPFRGSGLVRRADDLAGHEQGPEKTPTLRAARPTRSYATTSTLREARTPAEPVNEPVYSTKSISQPRPMVTFAPRTTFARVFSR